MSLTTITRPGMGVIIGFAAAATIQAYPACGLVASRMAFMSAGFFSGLLEGIFEDSTYSTPSFFKNESLKVVSFFAFGTAITVNLFTAMLFGSVISLNNVMITGTLNYFASKFIHNIIFPKRNYGWLGTW